MHVKNNETYSFYALCMRPVVCCYLHLFIRCVLYTPSYVRLCVEFAFTCTLSSVTFALVHLPFLRIVLFLRTVTYFVILLYKVYCNDLSFCDLVFYCAAALLDCRLRLLGAAVVNILVYFIFFTLYTCCILGTALGLFTGLTKT